MAAQGVFVLPGVRIWRGKVSIPVDDPVAVALILGRALSSTVLDDVVALLLTGEPAALESVAAVDAELDWQEI